MSRAYPIGQGARFLGGFAALYLMFLLVWRLFPNLAAGSDVIRNAKQADAAAGTVLPPEPGTIRVAMFGDSETLAALLPREFEALAAADGLRVEAYNFGIPAHNEQVADLAALARRGNAPDVALLSLPWNDGNSGPFTWPVEDDDMADRLFPFRHLWRDAVTFAANAPAHGGMRAYYREAGARVAAMQREKGWDTAYAAWQFPGMRVPTTFVPPPVSAEPDLRSADPTAAEAKTLRALLAQTPMTCLFVPLPERAGGNAAPPEHDAGFERVLKAAGLPCELTGPDAWRYPDSNFADYTHVNRAGAAIFTRQLYELVRPKLMVAQRAVQ